MIKKIIKQWERNKYKLKKYFETTKQSEFADYSTIVKKIFELCIIKKNDDIGWNIKDMTIIDDGDYQGDLIFIIPPDVYQPDVEDYIMTSINYGSCSACDYLLSINNYEEGLPTQKQVKEYMRLALHLVQKIKKLTN